MSDAPTSVTADRGRELLCGIAERLDELRDLDYLSVFGDELLELARVTETAGRSLYAVQVALAHEIDHRDLAARHACPSTASLLRQILRITAHDARVRVATARNVHEQALPSGGVTPPVLPELRAAIDAGLLDRSHIATVLATMKDLRDTLPDDVRAQAQQQLLAYARDLEPDQFRRVADHLAEILDPDGTPDQPTAFARAEFTIGVRNSATGLTSINGRLDDLSIETLRVAVDALAAPKPAVDGVIDPRPAATRRAHALVELLSRAVAHTDLPTHNGQRPHVAITVDWDLARHQVGTGVTDHGVTLSPGTVRRLLCDAAVTPAVLGGDSQVLDLGRTTRTFNHATRRAITLRDKGCVFPGCDRPPGWTDVHHLRFWQRDLGDTSYANGCLLCTYHHSEIHREQWHARMSTDGHPEFTPPRWIDPLQRPRRNTLHHLAPDIAPDLGSTVESSTCH